MKAVKVFDNVIVFEETSDIKNLIIKFENEAQKEISNLKQTVKLQDEEIDDLNEEVELQSLIIEAQEEQIADLQEEVCELEIEIEELEERIADLEDISTVVDAKDRVIDEQDEQDELFLKCLLKCLLGLLSLTDNTNK